MWATGRFETVLISKAQVRSRCHAVPGLRFLRSILLMPLKFTEPRLVLLPVAAGPAVCFHLDLPCCAAGADAAGAAVCRASAAAVGTAAERWAGAWLMRLRLPRCLVVYEAAQTAVRVVPAAAGSSTAKGGGCAHSLT